MWKNHFVHQNDFFMKNIKLNVVFASTKWGFAVTVIEWLLLGSIAAYLLSLLLIYITDSFDPPGTHRISSSTISLLVAVGAGLWCAYRAFLMKVSIVLWRIWKPNKNQIMAYVRKEAEKLRQEKEENRKEILRLQKREASIEENLGELVTLKL